MLPIGPIMIEHRLIERMIKVMDSKLREMKAGRNADTTFIETAVDIIRTYADRCHHGKEEDIRFRELKKKPIAGVTGRGGRLRPNWLKRMRGTLRAIQRRWKISSSAFRPWLIFIPGISRSRS